MKALYKGLAASVGIHGALVALFLALSTGSALQSRVIEVDFAIAGDRGAENGSGSGYKTSTNARSVETHRRRAAGQETVVTEEPKQRRTGLNRSRRSVKEYNAVEDKAQGARDEHSAGIVTDPGGSVETEGIAGSGTRPEGEAGGTLSARVGGVSTSGYGSGDGDGRVVRYGSGSGDEKSFRYIRDDIMRNVRYPERARRRGWTGKVLLSFVLSEGGSVQDLRVVNSSGFSELDQSAREAVGRTRFSQKVPHKLVVILPIEYRLE